jgi:hypothetical protein
MRRAPECGNSGNFGNFAEIKRDFGGRWSVRLPPGEVVGVVSGSQQLFYKCHAKTLLHDRGVSGVSFDHRAVKSLHQARVSGPAVE